MSLKHNRVVIEFKRIEFRNRYYERFESNELPVPNRKVYCVLCDFTKCAVLDVDATL